MTENVFVEHKNADLLATIARLEQEKMDLEQKIASNKKPVIYHVRASQVTQAFSSFEHAKAYAVREFNHQYEPLGPCDIAFLKKLENLSEATLHSEGCFIEYDNFLFTFEKSVLHSKMPRGHDAYSVWEQTTRQLVGF